MKQVTIAVGLAALFGILTLSAQAKKVTISTKDGTSVEGVLRSLTDAEIVVEIAGQPLRFPIDSIRYLSFVGKIDTPTTSATTPATSMELALKALKDLKAATEIGMLRDQYSQKIVETLTKVRDFTGSETKDWLQVKAAMEKAIEVYQAPLASLDAWKTAGSFMTWAAEWSEYAAELVIRPDENKHVETASDGTITWNQTVMGRLGIGDRVMTRDLDASTAGGFNDRFTLEVASTIPYLRIVMTCRPCRPHLTLQSAATGRQIDGDAGNLGTSTIERRNVPAGVYYIWAGTWQTQLGDYTLVVR
jgi:hypothetical protein